MADRLRDSLRTLLDAHVPTEPNESRYLVEFRSLLRQPNDIFDAGHFAPGHVTASGFVASSDRGSVLLIHHAKLGRWLQPGGHLEPADDTLEAGARRELAEEVGLGALQCLGAIDIDIHTFPERSGNPHHLHFDVRFGFASRSDVIGALDGVLAARWVPFAEIARMTDELSVQRPVEKLRQLLVSLS